MSTNNFLQHVHIHKQYTIHHTPYTGNYASLFYKYAMREVNAVQERLMASAIQQTRQVEMLVMQRGDAGSSEEVVKLLTKVTFIVYGVIYVVFDV
ncbi:hypothetical protein EON63_20845 [archaeon]|nr:MAG: hypothetical protein EON63_20845 [archaeon]